MNPFSYIKLSISCARGAAFIGRQRQLSQIMDMIAAPRPHHISIFGLPHVGKSSFVRKLQEKVSRESRYLCIDRLPLVDGDFCNNMISIIDALSDIEPDLEYLADSTNVDASPEELADILRRALLQIGQSGRRTVLLLDEFERILGPTDYQIAEHMTVLPAWTQSEYELFLELLMDRELDFVCITASRPQMDNILYRYHPATNPFIPILLNGFDDTEMKEYFNILKEGNICLDGIPLGQEPDRSQQQELLRLCGRSPYLLTVMGNELFENNRLPVKSSRKTVKGLFSKCRDAFQAHFNDIINFMVDEEQKKMRSFSHIVKCYFGLFEDYQDIKERCIVKGYLTLAAKNSPYTYRGKTFDFEDRDNLFPVYQEDGIQMTAANKRQSGLVYITVSPLFTDYLFSVRLPIGKKGIIPLDLIDDTRDLLTGLIHAMRDITRKEIRMICQRENIDADRWDEYLVTHYSATASSGEQIIHVNPTAQNNMQRFARWEKKTCGNVTRLDSIPSYPGSPGQQNWQTLWSARTIGIASISLKFVVNRIREPDNEMASLDPISLIDHMEIFDSYWQYDGHPLFSNYFSILPNGRSQLRSMMMHLREYRNKVSHFSRYGYGPHELQYSRIYCRQLLKGIYHYIYCGEKCPVGSISETPGV